MRISDWSSDVCSSDLADIPAPALHAGHPAARLGADCRGRRNGGDARAEIGRHAHARLYERGIGDQIGRASCWERVWQYVLIFVVPGSFKKNIAESTMSPFSSTQNKHCTSIYDH